MSLAAEIRAEAAAAHGPKCAVPQVLAELAPEDAADLTSAINDHSLPASAIARALRARNVPLGEYTVSRHRRGACKCQG